MTLDLSLASHEEPSSMRLSKSSLRHGQFVERANAGYRRVTVIAKQCRLMIRELRARGLDLDHALAELGICYSEADDLQQFVSAAQFEAFLRVAETLSGQAAIGLYAGQRLESADLDLLGLLLRSSHDMQAAHSYFRQYRAAAPDALDLDISEEGDLLAFRRITPGIRPSRTLSEYFLARVSSLVRLLLGAVEPLEVRLMHSKPSDIREHRRLLGERLLFAQSEDAIIFPASILTRPMLHCDPVAEAVLLRHFASLPDAGMAHADLVSCVRWAIQEELKHGRATMGEIAARLKLTERTLRRQLSELGVGFQQVLDEVRRDQAVRHLQASRYPVGELSLRLGFAGRAAFYRAFKRWTGMSLSEYRTQCGDKHDREHDRCAESA
jgi:AraC-like DNA-binding protein